MYTCTHTLCPLKPINRHCTPLTCTHVKTVLHQLLVTTMEPPKQLCNTIDTGSCLSLSGYPHSVPSFSFLPSYEHLSMANSKCPHCPGSSPECPHWPDSIHTVLISEQDPIQRLRHQGLTSLGTIFFSQSQSSKINK